MRTVILLIGGLIAVLFVTTAVVAVFFDWNWLRGPLEKRMSAASGDQVKLAGPIAGHLGLTSWIDLTDIQILNPGWHGDPNVGTIKRLHVALRIPALLRGAIEVPELKLDEPNLTLQRNSDGSSNFRSAEQKPPGPSDRSDVPLIDSFSINGGRIVYRDDTKAIALTLSFETVHALGGNSGDQLNLQGTGSYQGAPFSIAMQGGDFNELRDLSRPYTVTSFHAELGPTKITAKGRIGQPVKLNQIDLEMSIEGDSAADLYRYLGVPAPETPPYKLAGALKKDGTAWQFDGFKGTVGNSDLQGSLHFDLPPGKKMMVSGSLVTNRLDFADTGLIVGAPTKSAGGRASERQKAVQKRYQEDSHVFPDAPLMTDQIRRVNADVTFKGKHVEAQDLPLRDVDLRVRIENGVLKLDPLRIGVAGGNVDGSIRIDAGGKDVVTDYDLHLRQFQLTEFVGKIGHPEYADGTIEGHIQLKGTGDSVRRSLGSADGEVSMAVDDGHISKLFSNLLGLDAARAIGPLLSGDKSQTPLNCFVVDFGVRHGVMTSKTFLVDTDLTTVYTSGSIDLGKETLDLAINGRPKKPTPLALGGPILVHGTIKSPSIGLGAKAIARGTAAAALGVALTPLAAILAFIDPGTPPQIECGQLKG